MGRILNGQWTSANLGKINKSMINNCILDSVITCSSHNTGLGVLYLSDSAIVVQHAAFDRHLIGGDRSRVIMIVCLAGEFKAARSWNLTTRQDVNDAWGSSTNRLGSELKPFRYHNLTTISHYEHITIDELLVEGKCPSSCNIDREIVVSCQIG